MFFEALSELKGSDENHAQSMLEKYTKQRLHFFNLRIAELNKLYDLSKTDEKNLWGYLLAAEQAEQVNEKSNYSILMSLHKLDDKKELVDESVENQGILGWLYIYWSKAWREYAENNKYSLAARYVLKKQKANNDTQAMITTAEEDLAKELRAVLGKAEKFIGVSSSNGVNYPFDVDNAGLLELDKKVLDYFKQHNYGQCSRAAIKKFQNILEADDYDINKRMELWDRPLFFAEKIAAARWVDVIKKYVHEKQEKPTALTSPIFQQLSRAMVRGNSLNADGSHIIDASGEVIMKVDQTASIDITAAKSLINSEIPLLSSVWAHHVVRWLLINVHKQFLLNIKEPRKLIIEGGYPQLADLSGVGISKQTPTAIRKIIHALAGCIFRYKREDRIGEGNFLSFRYEEARGQNLSLLVIEMQPLGCPGFVEELPIGGLDLQEQRQLIPIVNLPVFIGRDNDHASQASFQMELLIEMRLRAKELYERGGILLSDNDFLSLAQKANMTNKIIKKVIDTWIKESYLSKIDDHVYNIGSRYPEAQQMLKQAGKLETDGAEAGKKRKKAQRRKYQKNNLILNAI